MLPGLFPRAPGSGPKAAFFLPCLYDAHPLPLFTLPQAPSALVPAMSDPLLCLPVGARPLLEIAIGRAVDIAAEAANGEGKLSEAISEATSLMVLVACCPCGASAVATCAVPCWGALHSGVAAPAKA